MVHGAKGRSILDGVLAVLLLGGLAVSGQAADAGSPASNLPDLSGIVWMEGDTFLAVHDAKNPDELDRPRVSLVRRATTPAGVTWQPLFPAWPSPGGPSNDLESIARIPGTRSVLLVESGDDGGPFQRIFLATLTPSCELVIDDTVSWPEPVFNVEASAVALLGGTYYLVYAERAEGESSTLIRWAPLELNPLRFGPFRSAHYTAPGLRGPGARPVVALDVAESGAVYAAAAIDSGDDNGPFRSYVSQIGQFRVQPKGDVRLTLTRPFANIATLDGLKVEGVAVIMPPGGPFQVYAGTDDENYGATMRPVWPLE